MELYHHGIKGQKWGVENGPPYPLTQNKRSNTQQKLNKESISSKMLLAKHKVGEMNGKLKNAGIKISESTNAIKNEKNRLENEKTKEKLEKYETKLKKQEAALKKRKPLTDEQKKKVAVILGAAAVTAIIYGTYKHNKNKRIRSKNLEVEMPKIQKMNTDVANLTNEFSKEKLDWDAIKTAQDAVHNANYKSGAGHLTKIPHGVTQSTSADMFAWARSHGYTHDHVLNVFKVDLVGYKL